MWRPARAWLRSHAPAWAPMVRCVARAAAHLGSVPGPGKHLRTAAADMWSCLPLPLMSAGMNKMVINHLEKLFVTSDASTIVQELEVQHPAAKLLVMAAQAQQQEIGDGTNMVGAGSARPVWCHVGRHDLQCTCAGWQALECALVGIPTAREVLLVPHSRAHKARCPSPLPHLPSRWPSQLSSAGALPTAACWQGG